MIRTVIMKSVRPAEPQMLVTRDEMMAALWRAGTASRTPVISNAKPSRTPPRG